MFEGQNTDLWLHHYKVLRYYTYRVLQKGNTYSSQRGRYLDWQVFKLWYRTF